MKTRSLRLQLLALLVLAAPLAADTTIQNTTYTSGQNVTVNDSTITAGPGVIVASGAVVTFRASTRITLGPGFTAASGGTFHAFVGADGDGDGMDDSWEQQYGLNPNSNDAAGDLDGDGLSNLAEYLLGTNPAVVNSSDTSNQNNLKVHRPLQ